MKVRLGNILKKSIWRNVAKDSNTQGEPNNLYFQGTIDGNNHSIVFKRFTSKISYKCLTFISIICTIGS